MPRLYVDFHHRATLVKAFQLKSTSAKAQFGLHSVAPKTSAIKKPCQEGKKAVAPDEFGHRSAGGKSTRRADSLKRIGKNYA
jgi:hypothetical protein